MTRMTKTSSLKMKKTAIFLIVVISIISSLWGSPAQAHRGLPDSSEFGYGARVDPWGAHAELAVYSAAAIGLDWIGIDLSWQHLWTERDGEMNLANLDKIMSTAKQLNLNVLISISRPPGWATTSNGPDLEITSGLVAHLLRMYPGTILAIELFPGANTVQGWGATPHPQAYAELLQAIHQTIQAIDEHVVLVSGGLSQIPADSPNQDIDDLIFLNELYQSGALPWMPVVGVRMAEVFGDPISNPETGSTPVMRHYEQVRQVMLDNGHSHGLIWITGYSWPEQQAGLKTENLETAASIPATLQQVQSAWLTRAIQLMRSQLYIGVAFYDCLNPPSDTTGNNRETDCLIQHENDEPIFHPAVASLKEIIMLERGETNTSPQLFSLKKIQHYPYKRSAKP